MTVLEGLKTKLDEELAEDRAFLAKLKPALIRARMRGELPTDEPPGTASSRPQPTRRPGSGPNPWLVLGAAFAIGYGLAKLVDWRGHAHPRD